MQARTTLPISRPGEACHRDIRVCRFIDMSMASMLSPAGRSGAPAPAQGPRPGPLQRRRTDPHRRVVTVGRLPPPPAAARGRSRRRGAGSGVRLLPPAARCRLRRPVDPPGGPLRRATRERDIRDDQARLTEVLRLRREQFDVHGDRRRIVPGRSWAAWARALGHLLPALDVVDIGCGEGYLALEMAAWARTVVGIDRSDDVLERARGPRRPAPDHQRRLEEGRPRPASPAGSVGRPGTALPVAAPCQ